MASSGNNFNASQNIGAIAGRTPRGARGWIRNLVAYSSQTAVVDTLELAFRPPKVTHSIGVKYNEMAPLGMSHGYAVYENTENDVWRFEIYQNRLMRLKDIGADLDAVRANAARREAYAEANLSQLRAISRMMEEDRRFLQALTVPPAPEAGVSGTEPPPCILCIPKMVTQRVRLMTLEFTYDNCDIEGNIVEWTANVTFREAPMGRITMEDVMANGSFRSWGQG